CVFLSFFFSSRRRHTRFSRDWSSDVCSSDLVVPQRRQEDVAAQQAVVAIDQQARFQTPVALQKIAVQPLDLTARAGVGREADTRSEERRVGKERRVGWDA